jgi:hypothetical protein
VPLAIVDQPLQLVSFFSAVFGFDHHVSCANIPNQTIPEPNVTRVVWFLPLYLFSFRQLQQNTLAQQSSVDFNLTNPEFCPETPFASFASRASSL